MIVADELTDSGVENAQRVRQKDSIEDFDLVAFTTTKHGADKITRAVHGQAGSSVKTGGEIAAGDMRQVMLDEVHLPRERRWIGIETPRDVGVGRFDAVKVLQPIGDRSRHAGQVRQDMFDFLPSMYARIAGDRQVLDIADARPRDAQALVDGLSREAPVVLAPVEPLLGDGGY